MKSILIVLFALSAQVSTAACLGEAQIIAKVESVSQRSANTCIVKINSSSIEQYNESMVCPLNLTEVLESGVEVSSVNEQACFYKADQDISGVLVKSASGGIYLE